VLTAAEEMDRVMVVMAMRRGSVIRSAGRMGEVRVVRGGKYPVIWICFKCIL